MRIENRNVRISEIFEEDSGECIEINMTARTVTIYLIDDGGDRIFTSYGVEEFRDLLSAMQAANNEIDKIENPV